MSNQISLLINEMVDTVSNYIIAKETKEELAHLDKNSFNLLAQPGVGKSDAIRTIAKVLEKRLNKKVVITDVRLLLFNPVDLRGIPVPDASREMAIWLRPKIFQMDDSSDVINILFLDEISAAPPSVQAAAYQITLDRQIGEHKLPDNCYVICAGNRVQDKSVAYKMPKALANRLTHFEVSAVLDDWKKWALNAGIDRKIIAYLNAHPNKLNSFDPSSDDNAFPTPRSWEFVNNYLKIMGSVEDAYNLIAGAIGLGTALEFKTYCKVFTNLPDIKDILAGKKDVKVPTEPDVLYALTSTIVIYAKDSKPQELSNIFKYLMRKEMSKEFSVKVVKDMILVDGMREKMFKIDEWGAWCDENKSLIL